MPGCQLNRGDLLCQIVGNKQPAIGRETISAIFALGKCDQSEVKDTYNALGLETSEVTLDGTWTYTYDADGQLIHAVFASTNSNVPSQDLAYSYDSMGNRITTVINGTTTTYTTNNVNEYTSVGSVADTYDKDGNLLSDGTNTYTYNSLNQLISVTGPSGTTTYTYNALGQQVSSTTNGLITQFVMDPTELGDVVGDYGGGATVADYIYGIGLTAQKTATGSNFYDFNAGGSTADITNSSSQAINTYDYLPFGSTFASTGSAGNPFTFGGQSGAASDGDGGFETIFGAYDAGTGQLRVNDNAALSDISPVGNSNPNNDYVSGGVGVISGFTSFWLSGSALNEIQAAAAFGTDFEEAAQVAVRPVQYGATAFGVLGLGADVVGLANGGDNWFGTGLDASAVLYDNPVVAAVAFDYNLIKYVNDNQTNIMAWGDAHPWVGDQLLSMQNGLEDFFGGLFGPSPPGGGAGGNGATGSATPMDPNAMIGPAGYGSSNFVADAGTILPYQIDFENAASATAPAQAVTITDQLDANLNWSTFQLTGIAWGDTILSIPAGSQFYETTVPMTYDGVTFNVQVEAGIHTATGQVYATFQSIDPNTELPPDVLIGFLPPENGTGRGTGYVSFLIQPNAGLPTGTQIRNVANVTFDTNPAIATDQVSETDPSQGVDSTKQALATIDSGPPTSSVNADRCGPSPRAASRSTGPARTTPAVRESAHIRFTSPTTAAPSRRG